jgi:hypothetical protein
MQGLDQILGSSGMDIGSLAARFGISPDQATSAVGSLVPAVAGGMQNRAADGGLDTVASAGHAIGEPDTASGNDILGHVFGSKDVSRQVADHAAGQSGVSSTVVKAMLPIVAAMVAKHFAQNGGAGADQASGGGLGGLLGSMLGGGQGSAQGGGIGGGLGGLGGLLGGGNPLDAILGGRR